MDFDSEFMEMCSELGEFKTQVIQKMFENTLNDSDRIVMVSGIARKYECLSSLFDKTYTLHQQENLKPLKPSPLSLSYRVTGNNFFQKKLFSDAISSYSQSVLVAEGECLALAYANRSAAFLEIGDWLHSLRDIQLALDNNYPKKLEYKLRERQGNCWFFLKEKINAINSYVLAKDLLVAYPLDDPNKLENIVAKLKKFGYATADARQPTTTDALHIEEKIHAKRKSPPKLYKVSNVKMPSASSAVKLSYISGRGRCLIATEDLELGSVIMVEKAFTSVLMREFNGTHCHYCLHWTPGPIPCLRCSQVGFCSTICRDSAWATYHHQECGFFDLLQRSVFNETLLLALRTVLNVDRDTLANIKTDEELVDQVYQSTDYRRVQQFVGHSSDLVWSDMFRRAVLAVYMVGLVRGESDIELSIELLRLLQSIPLNVFSINQVFSPPKSCPISVTKLSTEVVAVAVMPLSCLSNHSCDPNVTRKFYGNVMTFRVFRPIKKGDEILTSYGYEYPSYTKDVRQSKLKQGYFFDCNCRACTADWPRDSNLPKLTNRPHLSLSILTDLSHFYDYQFYYSDQSDDVNMQMEKFANIFIGHLNSLDGDRKIRHPLREYTETQDALNHCFDLMATVSPRVKKQSASSNTEQLFRDLYLKH